MPTKRTNPDISETLQPKTELVRTLLEARRKIIASSQHVTNRKQILREIAELRAGRKVAD